MPFSEFVKKFPKIAKNFKDLPMYDNFLKDPCYIVRLSDDKIEIGYSGDKWEIR